MLEIALSDGKVRVGKEFAPRSYAYGESKR